MSSTTAGLVARGRGFYKAQEALKGQNLVHPMAPPRVAHPASALPMPLASAAVFPPLPRMPATAPMPQVVQGRPSYASAVNVGAPAAVGKPFHHHPHAVHQVHHDVLAASAAQRAWVPVISAPIPRAHSGILMEFRNHRDEGHLGLLEGPVEGTSRWSILTSAGDKVAVEAADILFVWPHSFLGQVYSYDVEDIERLEQLSVNLVSSYQGHLKIAWGSYLDRGVQTVTPEMLAHFLFGPTPKPHERFAAHRLLLQDALYFERKPADLASRHAFLMNMVAHPAPGGPQTSPIDLLYACRSRDDVNRIEKDRKDAAYYDAQRPRFLERARRKLAGTMEAAVSMRSGILPDAADDLQWRPQQDRVFIDRIVNYALAEGDALDERVDLELLKPLGAGSSARDAYDLLVKLGVWSTYQNMNLVRFRGPLEFNEADLQKFSQLSIRFAATPAHSDKDAKLRKDLTRLQPVFAIDNESLVGDRDLEIDDGLSVEAYADGSATVYVHIADPSRMMALGDSLDKVARKRVTSIFLPESRYPMLPPPLTSKHFSLLPNKVNHTLTFEVRLSAEGELLGYDIMPATIAGVKCMSYEEADVLFADAASPDSAALRVLSRLAEKRKLRRYAAGAIPGSLPNADVEVAKDGAELALVKTDTNSVTRNLVSEFMVLVGEITADFAARHNVPLPFRSQALRHDAADLEGLVPRPQCDTVQLDLEWLSDMLQHWHRRSLLLPPFTAPEPKPHRGLGVKSYAQATSPIRRYTDLLVHYQIKAVLRGETPPLGREQLMSVLNDLDARQQDVSRLQSHSQRYWMLRFLERQESNRVYLVLVLSVNLHQRSNNVHAVFLDLGYKTTVTLDEEPKAGEVIRLRVFHVDAFENDLQVEWLRSSPLQLSPSSATAADALL